MISIRTIPTTTSDGVGEVNSIVIAALLSWGVVQIVKVVIGVIGYGPDDRRRMAWRVVRAGGMPSAHSALIASRVLTTYASFGKLEPERPLESTPAFCFGSIYHRGSSTIPWAAARAAGWEKSGQDLGPEGYDF